jgi:hypothetical protein
MRGSDYLEHKHPCVQKPYLLWELPIEFSGSYTERRQVNLPPQKFVLPNSQNPVPTSIQKHDSIEELL